MIVHLTNLSRGYLPIFMLQIRYLYIYMYVIGVVEFPTASAIFHMNRSHCWKATLVSGFDFIGGFGRCAIRFSPCKGCARVVCVHPVIIARTILVHTIVITATVAVVVVMGDIVKENHIE